MRLSKTREKKRDEVHRLYDKHFLKMDAFYLKHRKPLREEHHLGSTFIIYTMEHMEKNKTWLKLQKRERELMILSQIYYPKDSNCDCDCYSTNSGTTRLCGIAVEEGECPRIQQVEKEWEKDKEYEVKKHKEYVEYLKQIDII